MTIALQARELRRMYIAAQRDPYSFQLAARVRELERALDARCIEKLSGEVPERLVEDIFRGSAPERSSRSDDSTA